MAADDPHRIENGLSSRMMFQDEVIHFSRTAAGGVHTAPRKASGGGGGDGSGFGRSQYGSKNSSWNLEDGLQSDGSDEEEEDEEDGVDDEYDLDENHHHDNHRDHHHDNNAKNGNNSSCSVQSSSDKWNGEKARNLQERHSPFGLSRGMMGKDFNLSEQPQPQHERMGNYENAITVVQPELYSSQNMNGGDCLGTVQKETRGESGYGNGGRMEMLIDPGESLRTHLLDPITGVLMDDAMILPCGHSFGSGGMQHVLRMKACCKCSRPVADNSLRENLALRSAVQAFRREEESQSLKASKRRRDRFELEKSSHDDPYPMDSRGKGVQFPFVVSDRVIIKGNKRTPQRFVGRVAVVTTQCLNGWYVVKTLDNAESVKLQYRSLAKVPDDVPPSNVIQNKSVTPSWL